MSTIRTGMAVLAAVATAAGASACGGNDDEGSGGGGGTPKTLKVVTSLPLQGGLKEPTTALVGGAKLALEQAGGKAGSIKITYESLDDSTAQTGSWDPAAVSQNARKAARDESIAVYIGEFNSGASAISIPVLNEAGVPQISPANTAVGLTSDDPGADEGEPEKYYPTGKRNYVRIVPKDTIQGAALATVMEQDECTKVAMANDKEVYGAGLAKNIASSLEKQGVALVMNAGIDSKAPNFRSLADRAAAAGADCFVFAGTSATGGVQLYKDFAAALGGKARLYGPDGVANASVSDPAKGGVPTSVGRNLKLSVATLNPDSFPEAGQRFFKEFKAKYNVKNPDPYAIYGYEAMRLALDAIERSKTGRREDIIEALFDTKDRDSVLGTYSIDENGDTTLTDYGIYTVQDGQLVFDQTVKAAP
ncbi:MAG TPA: branched-chain amino acid ABC transporter substrate-binding protein [Solirubrobacteraceae bacterium]